MNILPFNLLSLGLDEWLIFAFDDKYPFILLFALKSALKDCYNIWNYT